MKTTCFTLMIALAFATGARAAEIITQWNFNSNPPDTTSNTGTNGPSIGTGTVAVVGTVIQNVSATQEYSSGNNSTDPATADDSAYHTRNYPPQNNGSKTSGIEVKVSTVGRESIVVTWDQQNSATANKYLRFQYSTDGSNFVDYVALTMPLSGAFVNGRTVNLTPIVAANENPNFAFRLVSEFEDTATGSGISGYVPSGTGTYSQNGTMRFDMLTISGSQPDGNAFPTASSIPNQTSRVDNAVGPIAFTVADAETPVDDLIVNGTSSNPGLVPDSGILIEGTGANRTVTVQPVFDQTGATTISLWVIDSGGKSNSTSFVLTVLPNNTPPTLSSITNVHTVKNAPFAPISFTLTDLEQNDATLSASSSDQTLIPDVNMVFSGTGTDRILTITPATDQVGNAIITVTATDSGQLTATRTFNAMVVPSSGVVLSEAFSYGDGSLVGNSARLWTTRAGTPGQMQIVLGTALVTGSQSEDVVARLIAGPYDPSGSTVLYASFDVTFSALPAVAPDIFAHFSGTDAANLRGRVLASTTNAGPGYFRLGIANGGATSSASNVMDYPVDLSLDIKHQVVVCHDVHAGTSKLWVNPAAGGGWVNAIDPVGFTPINYYGLRQSGGIGDMRIDNLLVGLSFEDVTPNLTRVRIRRSGDVLEVSWPSDGTLEGYILESTLSLANPVWRQVQEAVNTVGDWDIVTLTQPTGERYFRLVK